MNVDARLVAIVGLAREGQREAALLDLRGYLRSCPTDADAWVVLGYLAPDPKVALAAYRRALDLKPGHAAARRALAALASRVPPSEAPVSLSPSSPPAPEPLETEPETTADADFQTVRQARAVIWPFLPRGKQRPLGELLDERQVTRQDLQWAADEARSEDVREASRVMLSTAHRLLDVAMAMQDARLIAWPYRRLNRPLGELVDAGTVRVKDLRRASWFAKDARLREAARLMLPQALAQREAHKRRRGKQSTVPEVSPSPPSTEGAGAAAVAASPAPTVADSHTSHPMVVIQGANYLADEVRRRDRWQAILAAVMVVVFLVGLCGLLAFAVWTLAKPALPPLWVLPVTVGVSTLLYWLSNRLAELRHEGRNFRSGQLGETRVAQQLRHGLGGEWTLFRNVRFPGNKVDIDMVLLGPPGVFSLEVKAYAGPYQYHDQHFYRRTAVGWRRLQHNPGKQARAGAGMLHAYITTTLNQNVWVEPRLVWVGSGSLQLQNPEVYVWFFDRLDQETKRLRGLPPRLSAEERAALSGLLRGLCSTLR